MSEEPFEVRGPEEDLVEQGARSGDTLAGRVAVMTAILATVGAVFSYQGGSTQSDAMMYKNEAVLRRTEASDQWAYYQAKSGKQNLAELASVLVPGDKKGAYEAEVDRYKQEKEQIRARAEALEAEAKRFNELSEHSLHPHHRLALATTLIQIAISIAAITVLTRKRWLFWASGVAATLGAVLWAFAWLAL